MFEREFEVFLREQKLSASGRRLEMLNKDLTGETKLLKEVLWPVLKSFDGLVMEYEMVSTTGVRIYADIFYEPLGIVFESDGFVAHAENITRERFAFERMRVRTMAMYGYKYVPFSWDEFDKKPEACIRSVYELLGRYGNKEELGLNRLSVHQRELLRFALTHQGPFRLSDVCRWLQLGRVTSREVVRKLEAEGLISPAGGSARRCYAFRIEDKAKPMLLSPNFPQQGR